MLIVGGGLCGLSVLDGLHRNGWDATLWEAHQNRLGGRIYTLRPDGIAGCHAEAGAERIRPHHHRVRALVKELGLELLPYEWPVGGGVLTLPRGERLPIGPGGAVDGLASLGLTRSEAQAGPFGMLRLGMGRRPVPTDPRVTGLDHLEAAGLTPMALEMAKELTPWPLGEMPAVLVAHLLTEQSENPGTDHTIKGGIDQLVVSLAARHTSRVRMGRKLQSLNPSGARVAAIAEGGHELTVDQVVLCLPIPVLRSLDIQHWLPKEDGQHLNTMVIAQEVKAHLEVDPEAWHRLGGRTFEARLSFPQVLWETPGASVRAALLLNAMAVRADCSTLTAEIRRGGASLEVFFGQRLGASGLAIRSVLGHSFEASPLAGCAFGFPQNGDLSQARPFGSGPVMVAGADLSSRPGWMEGALESAGALIQLLS